MRIAVITDWFSEQMGYCDHCLSASLASLGHEVHLISSTGQPYFDRSLYRDTYEAYLGPGVVEAGVRPHSGYTLHRLPFGHIRGRLYMRGLIRALAAIRPHIVQTFEVGDLATYQAALGKPLLSYRLFLESHIHASVVDPLSPPRGAVDTARAVLRHQAVTALNRYTCRMMTHCYAISPDTYDIATRLFGVPENKMTICPLGVDTDLFHPPTNESSNSVRRELRRRLGFSDNDIVCIYSGRLTHDKGATILSQALGRLRSTNFRFRGLFVGGGSAQVIADIKATPGCIVHPFVPTRELARYYWAADIGVWPKQESTSQLDAAACGLPLVLSDQVEVKERVDGSGLLYGEGDPTHLAAQLAILEDDQLRATFGARGAEKMRELFSWRQIAADRAQDYLRAIESS
jgi:glycosyltransferase involved in cell wall biosynthesis